MTQHFPIFDLIFPLSSAQHRHRKCTWHGKKFPILKLIFSMFLVHFLPQFPIPFYPTMGLHILIQQGTTSWACGWSPQGLEYLNVEEQEVLPTLAFVRCERSYQDMKITSTIWYIKGQGGLKFLNKAPVTVLSPLSLMHSWASPAYAGHKVPKAYKEYWCLLIEETAGFMLSNVTCCLDFHCATNFCNSSWNQHCRPSRHYPPKQSIRLEAESRRLEAERICSKRVTKIRPVKLNQMSFQAFIPVLLRSKRCTAHIHFGQGEWHSCINGSI